MKLAQHSRLDPSPRYGSMIEQYRSLHSKRSRYPGISLLPHVDRIGALIAATGARTLLDYGCGKATLHKAALLLRDDGSVVHSLREYWGVKAVRRYDPAIERFAQLPDKPVDGVICTDVLEHCPEADIDWIVAELFGLARQFVFASIAAYPARAVLPNGENAHCTVRPAAWWRRRFDRAARPGVRWELSVLSAPERASVQNASAGDSD